MRSKRKTKFKSATNCKISNNKRERICCRRSIFVILFRNFIKFLPLIILIVVVFVFGQDQEFYNYKLATYRFICLLFIAETLRQYFDSVYLIGNKRIIQMTGVLGLNYRRNSINILHIREVRLKQSIWGRIFNHGTLKMGTASTKDYEIIFKDIFMARKIRKLIENKVHFEREESESDIASFDNEHVTLALD